MNLLQIGRRALLCGLSLCGTVVPIQSLAVEEDAAKMRQPVDILEPVVVTATRTNERRVENPQRVDVINAEDIDRSIVYDLTDTLKKHIGWMSSSIPVRSPASASVASARSSAASPSTRYC